MSRAASAWLVERATGSAAAHHGRAFPTPMARMVWRFEVDGPALVVGSAQPADDVNEGAAARAGVAVVRRRSGGGAVLLVPGAALWIDVLIPAGDPLWHDDVGVAAHWLGGVWADALDQVGVEAAVWRGAMVRTTWSARVCFAGLGPGEVTVAGRKLVGISQRRTRAGARFQCVLHQRWDPRPLCDLLRLDDGARDGAVAELAAVTTGVEVPLADIEAAFLAALPG